MEIKAFQERYNFLAEQDPFLFEGYEPPASEADILYAERHLGCRFGPRYVEFLAAYGGGEMGPVTIFSIHRRSEWNIATQNKALGLVARGMIAFAPNYCGDHYGFSVLKGGFAEDRVVFYDHETDTIQETPYADIMEYILAQCTIS